MNQGAIDGRKRSCDFYGDLELENQVQVTSIVLSD